jgi:hypothetical protein
MYREAALRDPKEAPPARLVYAAVERDRHKKGMAILQVIALPALVAGALSVVVTPTVGLIGMIATAAGLVWWWRRAPNTQGAVLEVTSGELHVFGRSSKRERTCFRLSELEDVALDIKTIRRVEDGSSAIPAIHVIESRVAPDVDTARIVLIGEGGRRCTLTDAYLAHMDATEWVGKIRVFLRKHGWTPESEREG